MAYLLTVNLVVFETGGLNRGWTPSAISTRKRVKDPCLSRLLRRPIGSR